MSQSRLPRTELLEALEKELDAAGYSYREKCGRKHGRILVDVDGKEEPIFVSGTPSDHRAIKNAVGHLRRKIKGWRGDMQSVTNEDGFELIALRDGEIGGMAVPVADARNIHSFLGISRDFNRWMKDQIRRARLVDGRDYVSYLDVGNPSGGRPRQEYNLTIRSAQHIAMMSGSDRGFEVRDYYIECERRLQSREEVHPVHLPAAANDDVSALLEMLADVQSVVLAALNRSNASSLERVEDTKAALLHYLKVQLKEPSLAFFDDVRTRNRAAWDRDKLIVKELRDMRNDVNGLIRKAEQPILSRSFVWADWFDHDKIYQAYFPDQVIPNRRFLSQAISKSLDSYCKRRQRGFDMQSRRIGGRNVNLWHRDSVEPWLKVHGREIVRTHLAKCRRSGDVVEFKKAK